MEDRGGKPAHLRAALRSRAPGIRRISDPDVLAPDFRCPACVLCHFLLLSSCPLILSVGCYYFGAHAPASQVSTSVPQCYAVRFTAAAHAAITPCSVWQSRVQT